MTTAADIVLQIDRVYQESETREAEEKFLRALCQGSDELLSDGESDRVVLVWKTLHQLARRRCRDAHRFLARVEELERQYRVEE